MSRHSLLSFFLLLLTAVSVLLVYVFFYAYVLVYPEPGFRFHLNSGRIYFIDQHHPAAGYLQPGDRIILLNGLSFEAYNQPPYPEFFSLVTGENIMLLQVTRGSQIVTVSIPLLPQTLRTTLRNGFQFIPAVIFLVYSLIIILFLRPKDNRWALFILTYNLSAVWLAANVVLTYNTLSSPLILRVVLALCIPAYLHFCWQFPFPLRPLPGWAVSFGYLTAGVFGVLSYLNWLPDTVLSVGILAVAVSCPFLILLHSWAKPALRKEIRLIFILLSFLNLPWLVQAVLASSLESSLTTGLLAFALPGAPLAIMYTVFRRQLGGLELRINRAFTILLFALLLLTGSFAVIGLVGWLDLNLVEWPFTAVILMLLAGTIGAGFYPRFEQWAQRHLLGIPYLPRQLSLDFSRRIATSLSIERFKLLFCQEVFPTLMVRQAALLRLDSTLPPVPLLTLNISPEMLPETSHIPGLLAAAGQYLPPDQSLQEMGPCSWVRLVIILQVENQPTGLCLFGRRDPDDFYAMTEIADLTSMMDQAALALMNIEQAERLRSYHKAGIERDEQERLELSRELHDGVLSQLALLAMDMPEGEKAGQFRQAYQSATDLIRGIITGLRPAMINYGLRHALLELSDELESKTTPATEIAIHLADGDVRYDPSMEMHLYRIVQQACHNSISHGGASHISVSGWLQPDQVELCIEDNGSGFQMGENPDLASLLENRHFGLAGMYERAELLGARLHIHSLSGAGTRVQVSWAAKTEEGG